MIRIVFLDTFCIPFHLDFIETFDAMLSSIQTFKRNGLDMAAWLKVTLEKLPTWTNSKIDA